MGPGHFLVILRDIHPLAWFKGFIRTILGPLPVSSGAGEDPQLFDIDGDSNMWKNSRAGKNLAKRAPSFVTEHMMNFPIGRRFFPLLIPEDPI